MSTINDVTLSKNSHDIHEQDRFVTIVEQLNSCKNTLKDFHQYILCIEELPKNIIHENLSEKKDPFEITQQINNKQDLRSSSNIDDINGTYYMEFQLQIKETENAKNELSKVVEENKKLKLELEKFTLKSDERLERISHMQKLNLESNENLESLTKKSQDLEEKLKFQTDVSSNLAKHCRHIQSEFNYLYQQYHQLETSLELLRTNFLVYDKNYLKYEEYIKSFGLLFLSQKQTINDLRKANAEHKTSQLNHKLDLEKLNNTISTCNTTLEEMKKQLDLEHVTNEFHREENSKMLALIEKQAKLIEKEQKRIKNLELQIELIKESENASKSDSNESLIDHDNTSNKSENDEKYQELLALIEVEKMKREEMALQHQETVKKLQHELTCVTRERNEAMVKSSKALKNLEEFNREKVESKTPDLAFSKYSKKNTNSPASEMNSKKTKAREYEENNTYKHYVESSSIEFETSVDELVADIFSPNSATSNSNKSESFDLLPPSSHRDWNNLKGNYNQENHLHTVERSRFPSMKCCQDQISGLGVHCHKCKNNFHISCAEKMSPMISRRKNARFICDDCKPKIASSNNCTKASPRRPTLKGL